MTKLEMHRLWATGMFGNTPRIWVKAEDLLASDYTGEVTIRTADRAGGTTIYRVPAVEAVARAAGLVRPVFNESMPDDKLLIQGEVKRGEFGLDLNYDCTPGRKMNEARAHFTHASPLIGEMLLQRFLYASSLYDLYALLDLYDNAVIEFSAYACRVGRLPFRNTIVWEVREY